MKFVLVALVIFASFPVIAYNGEAFNVTTAQIGGDEWDAFTKDQQSGQAEANRRCGLIGMNGAQLVRGPKDPSGCTGDYSVHGQTEICIFTYVCR